jgi:hypothetical protein
MDEKNVKSIHTKKNKGDIIMRRTKSGEISKTYISKIRSDYKDILKDKKGNVDKFLKEEFKKAKDSGIGLVFQKNGNVIVKDLFTKKGRQLYIAYGQAKNEKYHNIDIGDVKAKQKRLQKIDEMLSKKKNTLKPSSVKRELIAKGIITKYLFRYGDYTEDFMENVKINIDRAIKSVIPKHKGQKFIIRLSTSVNALSDTSAFGVKTYGTPSISELKSAMENKLEMAIQNYGEGGDELNFQTIGIGVISEPYGQILGAGGHKSIQTAVKNWFISNQTSRTNCFYRCLATHNIMVSYNKENDLDLAEDELVTNPQKFLDRVNNSSKSIKKRLKFGNIRATSDIDIQKYVDNCYKKNSSNKCEVKIYNNVFQMIKVIRPTNWEGESLKITYEIQNINHHYIALIRWYNVTNLRNILDMVIKKATEKAKEIKLDSEGQGGSLENELIDRDPEWEIVDWDKFAEYCKNEIWNKKEEKCIDVEYEKQNASTQKKYQRWFMNKYGRTEYCKRYMDDRNIRIGAYDLEATPNGVDGDMFRAYRLSFCYNIVKKNKVQRIKTVTFGGADCIEKWFEWLYKNRNELAGYTLYAHNGGKFDVLLLLNDYILKNTSKWVLEEGSLIVLNGAYLSFCLTSKEGDIENIETIDHKNTNAKYIQKAIDRKKEKGEDNIECLLTFRDSMRLLPGSLKKLCDEFDVEHKKLSEVVNFEEVNLTNCFGGHINSDRPFSNEKFKIELCNYVYCNYDVIGLLEILNKFSKSVYDACNGINITDCITGASLSKKHYFNTFYDKKETPVYNLSNKFDEFCREGYFGGRCEAFYIGEQKKKLYYYDFTSLYPDVGRCRLPYGEPKKLEEDRIELWNEWYKCGRFMNLSPIRGIVKVRVKTKNFDALPLHACKEGHRLTFAHFEDWSELTLWYRELEYAIGLDIYEYELIDGIEFTGGHHTYVLTSYMNSPMNKKNKKDREHFWNEGILKDFFEDAVNKKALAKKNGQPALAQAYKIIANSGYGFWGLNANGDGEGRDGMSIVKEDDDYFWELMAKGCVSNMGKIGDYIMVRTAMRMSVKDFNVAIATAICSEARMKTYRFLKAVKDNGMNILYCDTDSCICDLKLNDYPEMMKEFCWDGNGEDLGSMKNECLEKVECYYKNKILKEMGNDTPKNIWKPLMEAEVKKEMENDGGELAFDKGIIAGCKQYSLHKTLLDGGSVVAGACKGCKRKLSYEEFQHLLYGTMIEEQRETEKQILLRNPKFKIPEGYRLYERQTQFRSSQSDHLREGDYTEIRRIDIDKSIRVNYTKGIVKKEGWVVPHILNLNKDEDEEAFMGNAY